MWQPPHSWWCYRLPSRTGGCLRARRLGCRARVILATDAPAAPQHVVPAAIGVSIAVAFTGRRGVRPTQHPEPLLSAAFWNVAGLPAHQLSQWLL